MPKINIIIPTHSSYKNTVLTFLQLLEKNWQNCPYDIIVSMTGKKTKIEKYTVLYNGKNASLIDCLANATKKYPSDYYISFLGDAFINKKINAAETERILETLAQNKIDYCSLNYVRNYKKAKNFDSRLRYINPRDRYSHSFVAFVASRDYILNELTNFSSDLDFEKHYLACKSSFYYNNHLIVKQNYFNILPSIEKGKWDRINLCRLKHDNPEVKFEQRPISSLTYSLIVHARKKIIRFLPSGIRNASKKILSKTTGRQFTAETQGDRI